MHQTILIQISLDEFENTIKNCLREVILEFQQRADTVKNNEEFLTIKQTSEFLHVTKATLHNWHKQKKLVPKRIGNRVLYNKEHVMSALKDIDRLKYKNAHRTIDCVSVHYRKRLLTTTIKNTTL